nr:hypothetical protein [uncultured Dongia sp.]
MAIACARRTQDINRGTLVIALLAFGYGTFHWSVALACGLIVTGALIAAKDMIWQRRKAPMSSTTGQNDNAARR